MIERVTEKKEKSEVLDLMEPLIAEWFDKKFDTLTEPQGYAIPLIHERENVLVSSPTGSGKTLTAFLSIINELFIMDKKGELEDKIYCVYVSPLKALANDIHKNLEEPLAEIKKLAEEKDVKVPEIRTAIRSGDTSQKERRKMVNKPPHILITTPESLALVLSSPKFRERFDNVQYFIMDEIHDISSSKRGVYLSLNTERLQDHVKGELVRIGLSATQAPIREIAKFLGGFENGKPRPVNIIEVMGEKHLDLSVISPVDDMTLLPYEVVNSRMYDLLAELVDGHRTTLIFTNTRSGAENVSYKLRERGIDDIAAHHGSLSKETRITVEDDLKEGELTSAVSSTSLELGIDVGYIDLVIQVGSPKSVAKGLQRVGRAGHAVGETSKGRMIVFEKDDLIECAVLTEQAYKHQIDRVDIPENNLDVLAQAIVGMSLEKRWDVNEAYEMIKRAYCYRNLSKEDYESTLRYLSGGRFKKVYPKIWHNEDEGVFGKKGGVQMIYYLNVGTIPSDSNYRVYSDRGVPLGKLSEKFVERLSKGDVFVLGGHTYQFMNTKGTRVFVRDASGKKPTVPSWTGEMLPRSFDLSIAIGEFRRKLKDKIDGNDVVKWLMDEYYLDKGSAQTIVSYFKEQKGFANAVPSDKKMVLEGYIDQNEKYNIIFHACFGRRVNDALSRAYAYKISKTYNCTTNVSVTDDNFMITTNKKIPLDEIKSMLNSDSLERILKRGVRNTELFKQRFRHCAGRALMILRNYKGRDISVAKQKIRSGKILDVMSRYEDHPIIKETFNEILYQVLDMKNAHKVLQWLEDDKMTIETIDYSETPSPFAHNIIMVGVSDVIMMEDRSSLLRQFHQRVLEQVIPEEEIEKFKFEVEEVENYYLDKKPNFDSKDEMLKIIKELQPTHVFKEKGNNVYILTDREFNQVRRWGKELLNEGKIQSIWMGDVRWVVSKDIGKYLKSLDQGEQPHGAAPVLNSLKENNRTIKEIYKETDLKLKEIENIIRDLERKRLVNRRGITEDDEYIYGLLSKSDVSIKSVEKVIGNYLRYDAPRSVEEIAYALSIPEDRAMIALNNLSDQSEVISGKLIIGEGKQYMLQEDYHNLRFPGKDIVSEEKVSEYRAEKQFGEIDSIKGYFRRFGEASLPYDVYYRVPDFSLEEWRSMRKKQEILEGRFVRRRVRYALKEDVPMYVGAYRNEDLKEKDKEILKLIKNEEANTLSEIKNKLDLPNDEIKDRVKKLDKNLYIVRKYTGSEGWSSKNYYRTLEIEPKERNEAIEGIVQRFIKGMGPISISSLRYNTGFMRGEVENVLSKLIRKGVISKVEISPSKRELYILTKELDSLKSVRGDEVKKLRILSKRDPATRPFWAEIYSRYGDDWIFPIIKEGKMIGAVEKWRMSGCIEIRHLDLDSDELLEETLDALDKVLDYHRLEGYDILRIRNFNNQPVGDLSENTLQRFFDKGYELIQGMLVKGNIVDDVYEEEALTSLVLFRQHLGQNKYEDIKEALIAMNGARSDYEVRSRTDGFYSLEWLYRRGHLYAGIMIPPYHMYALPSETAVYKAAKAYELDNMERDILDIVSNKEPVPKKTVYHLSPYSQRKTKQALDYLYEGLHITRDHNRKYITTPNTGLSEKKSKKKVIRGVFENFGIFSAENLSYYLGKDFTMAEVRHILSELVDEGLLIKGFLKKDDDTVYWMLSKAKEEVKDIKIKDNIVITPKDTLSLYFREEMKNKFDLGTCYIIFDGAEMVAGFSARIHSGLVKVNKFEGPDKYKKTIKNWAFNNNMGVRLNDKKGKRRISDYEVQKWYERTRGI
ncbi:MAG: ATP-dependent helicase [Thermoplasmatota archaeon]